MNQFYDFIQSEHFFAFLIACIVFLITILLVVKKRIGFIIALLLLLFSLAAGLLINNQNAFRQFLTSYSHAQHPKDDGTQDAFRKQMLQAVEDLKGEVKAEKENLHQVVKQVQDIVSSIDAQKQKLQQFIEETREKFKTEFPSNRPSPPPEPNQT